MKDQIGTFAALRGRWRLVALATLLAAFAGFGITALLGSGNGGPRYRAATVLTAVPRTDRTRTPVNLDLIAIIATGPQVQQRAAATLGLKTPPPAFSKRVSAKADAKGGTLEISAQGSERKRIIELANAFAQGTVAELAARSQADFGAQLQRLKLRLSALEKEVARLNKKFKPIADPRQLGGVVDVGRTQRDAKVREYSQVYDQYQNLLADGPSGADVRIAQNATLAPVKNKTLRAPPGRLPRVGITALLGLVAGMVVALVLERTDPRIRDRHQAAQSFGLPVLAEVPLIPGRRRRRRELTVATAPRSELAAAFRLIRTGLAESNGTASGGNGHQRAPRFAAWSASKAPVPRRATTILVTSPNERSGKTNVAANIAGIFAETGREVIALSADLRRPALHTILGISTEPGLVQLIDGDYGSRTSAIHATSVPKLRGVPSGGTPDNPGAVLGNRQALSALSHVQSSCDVAVIDAPSILEASDASPFLAHVDQVLLVARAGRTSVDAARRAAEFLTRVDVQVAGVVLVGSRRSSAAERLRAWLRETRDVLRALRPRRRHADPEPDAETGLDVPQPVLDPR